MAHTSGYVDYVDDLDFLVELDRPWTPEELLALNYIVAALVIDAATGVPWTTHVRDRLLVPHGLDRTLMPSVDGLPDDIVHGYMGELPDPADVTWDIDATTAWSSGEMVADAHDLVTWARALFGGDALTATATEALTTPITLPDGRSTGYGYGCYVDDLDGHLTWGHSGSTLGFQSRLRWRPADGVAIAVLVNHFFSEADEIDATLWPVLGSP